MKIFPAVFRVLYDHKANHLVLGGDEVKKLEALVALLDRFEEATVMVSSEKQPTAGLILPMLHQFHRHLSILPDDMPFIHKCKDAMRSDLMKRYQDDDVKRLLTLASVTHPRFKGLAWMENDEREAAYTTLHEEAEKVAAKVPQNTLAEKAPDDRDESQTRSGFFDDDILASADTEEAVEDVKGKVDDEVKRYRSERVVVAQGGHAAVWWKAQRARFPILSRVAASFMSIPATSVPSERVFSTAGAIVTKKRSSLSPENVNHLVFLNANGKYFK